MKIRDLEISEFAAYVLFRLRKLPGFLERKNPVKPYFTGKIKEAGDGNRTHVFSLEG